MKTTTMKAPKGHYVYILKDVEGQVIYVGKSFNILYRIGEHLRHKVIGPMIDSFDLIKCRNELQAARIERRLIREHQPRLNFHGNPLYKGKPLPYLSLSR